MRFSVELIEVRGAHEEQFTRGTYKTSAVSPLGKVSKPFHSNNYLNKDVLAQSEFSTFWQERD